MGTKVSLNMEDKVLAWVDRFKVEKGSTLLSTNRTDTIQTDLICYSHLIKEGIFAVAQKITAHEFVVLTGAFNGMFMSDFVDPHYVIKQILDYDIYSVEMDANCKAYDIDKEQLLQTIQTLNGMECYALLEYIRRFWNQSDSSQKIEDSIENIGLPLKLFKK